MLADGTTANIGQMTYPQPARGDNVHMDGLWTYLGPVD